MTNDLPKKTVIRCFQPGEESALWEVFHNAVHSIASKNYSAVQVNAWSPENPDRAQWAERIYGINPFVAEREGCIVGYADLQSNGFIDHFFVSAAAARQGDGSALMRKLHETALEKNIPALFSNVSLTAQPFFEKWGFVVESRQTVFLRGVGVENARMSKSLAQK
jgi:putative acetyltransferase